MAYNSYQSNNAEWYKDGPGFGAGDGDGAGMP